MATSSSYDFSLNRNDLIKASLRLINVIAQSEAPTNDQIVDASQALNIMIKAWQAQGIGLWLNKEIILFLQADDIDYSLGSSGDNCALTSDAVKTELSAAAAASATTISVDSITGIADGDYIGVETSNGDLHWTTVNGSPSGTTVTLTTGLDYACVVDAHVYAYTTKIQRPLEILEARLVAEDDTETPLNIISRDEYMMLTDKTTESSPSQVYYDPQTSSGVLYVWPEPDDMKERIKMTAKYLLQDMDAAANNFDFPVEWTRALKFNLAVELAPEYEAEVSPFLLGMAEKTLADAMSYDREHTSVYFQRKSW